MPSLQRGRNADEDQMALRHASADVLKPMRPLANAALRSRLLVDAGNGRTALGELGDPPASTSTPVTQNPASAAAQASDSPT